MGEEEACLNNKLNKKIQVKECDNLAPQEVSSLPYAGFSVLHNLPLSLGFFPSPSYALRSSGFSASKHRELIKSS